MNTIAWHPEIVSALESEDFERVIAFYEQLLEQAPEVICYYWYLGIAYLLAQREAEAQNAWLLVFLEASPEDSDRYTAELATILAQESDRQAAQSAWERAWLLRGHLRELVPNRLDNLLHLLNLEIILGYYSPERLGQWQLPELLQQAPTETIDLTLLGQSLTRALTDVAPETLAFVKASWPHLSPDFVLNQLDRAAARLKNSGQLTLAMELVQLGLQLQPGNGLLLYSLSVYATLARHDDLAWGAATQLVQPERSLSWQVLGCQQILSLSLLSAKKLSLEPWVERYKYLLRELFRQPPAMIELKLQNSAPLLGSICQYLQDDLAENRWLINHCSQLFQSQFEPLPPPAIAPSVPDQPRPLRIGYIAHTLRKHSVGWLCRWLFKYHDRQSFQIFLYLVNQPEDDVTEHWIKPFSDRTYNCPAEAKPIAVQIQKDAIDILVDLDSLTHGVTCEVLARKPAPIQVTWLGMDASGLPTVDYFIADPYVLPPEADDHYREKLWRLPQTYVAIAGFEIGTPTLRREELGIPQEAIVYLNNQNMNKLHPPILRLQLKILKDVPNSYLLFKGQINNDQDEQELKTLLTELAQAENINLDRFCFLRKDPDEFTHRANLLVADIALDTYPYNGSTTTLEALWLGIPLVTRVGEQFAARNSYAFMTNAGLTEGIAWTDAEYVEWGVRLGQDPVLREQVILKLKASRLTSPLWQAQQFTREMEKAYQQIWAQYLEQRLTQPHRLD